MFHFSIEHNQTGDIVSKLYIYLIVDYIDQKPFTDTKLDQDFDQWQLCEISEWIFKTYRVCVHVQ